MSLRQELRYALRQIRRSPGFSAVFLVTLALGIGANTAIFSLFDALLLRDLPVSRPERLVQVATVYRNGSRVPLSYGLYQQLERDQRVFSDVFAWAGGQESELEYGGTRTLCTVRAVSGNYFRALQTTPLAGRLIDAADADTAGRAPVAVLGYEFWRRQFGGDPSVIGKLIHIQGDAYTVVGITRRWFTGMTPGDASDITVAITAPRFATFAHTNASLWLFVAGRLQDGITLAQAETQLRSFWHEALLAALPTTVPGPRLQSFLAMRVRAIPARTGVNVRLRERFERPLQVLMALAALILLVACVNLANLALARAIARHREMSVRVSLGAKRGDLVRQALVDTLLLSGGGALLAIPFAAWTGQFLVALINGRSATPVVLDLHPDWRVFAFAVAAAAGTGLLIAIPPAWEATRRQPADVLRADQRTAAAGTGRLGRALVVAQIALSLVLLLGATLLLRTFDNLRTVDPNYQRQGVLEAALYPRPDAPKIDLTAYRKELIDSVASLPGVVSAAYANYSIPVGSGWLDNVSTADRVSNAEENHVATLFLVSPGFLRTLGIPLAAGRDFDSSDDEHHPAVAIANDNLAKALAASGNAVGLRVRFGVQPDLQQMEIVGVSRAARIINVRDAGSLVLFVPAAQHSQFAGSGTLYVRAPNPLSLERPIEQRIAELGQEFTASTRTLEDANEDALTEERATALLSGAFGALALLLAGLGLFGVMSYMVVRRTRELAIRMALGSERSAILRLVLRESLLLTFFGLGIGIPCALLGARFLGHLLFGVTAADPVNFVACAAALLLVGIAAGFWPAHRATGIAPAIALKSE